MRKNEHQTDPYVRLARQEGLRSRAALKLRELHARLGLFRPGMTVIDLGAAPGGWSQVAAAAVGKAGRVLALDILPMEPLPGVDVLQGDFTCEAVQAQLLARLDGGKADLVISDLAPNLSGVKHIDQPRAMHLAEAVLELAGKALRPGGGLLLKCFEGEGIEALRSALRAAFAKQRNLKPKASRPASREVYLHGADFRQSVV